MAELEHPPANLPPLPEHCKEAWARLKAETDDSRTRRGLRYLLCGWSYRDAAKAAGLAAQSPLSQAIHRYGLGDLIHRTDRLIGSHRQVAVLATEELVARGVSGGFADDSTRDIAVVAGVSTDKVRDWERQQSAPTDALTLLQRIGTGLVERGLTLDVSLRPATPAELDVVDVDCPEVTDPPETAR